MPILSCPLPPSSYQPCQNFCQFPLVSWKAEEGRLFYLMITNLKFNFITRLSKADSQELFSCLRMGKDRECNGVGPWNKIDLRGIAEGCQVSQGPLPGPQFSQPQNEEIKCHYLPYPFHLQLRELSRFTRSLVSILLFIVHLLPPGPMAACAYRSK